VLADTQTANVTASSVGAVLAQGDVSLDQSISRAVLTRGDVKMDQSGVALLMGRNIQAGENSGTILMIAGRVEGNVNSVFGPASSAAFGAAFAVAISLILWIRRQLS
jgi:hypothetical protein